MPNADDRQLAVTAREQRPLTADHIEEIKARIEAGAFASDTVLQATARAILERRDI